jgi:ornithine cyclodeaminase
MADTDTDTDTVGSGICAGPENTVGPAEVTAGGRTPRRPPSAAPADSLLYLDAADVASLCRRFDPLEVVTEAFLAVRSGEAGVVPEAALRWTADDGTAARSLVLPAWHDRSYGCKIINACVGNPDRGLPRAHGLIVLADPRTAAPVCLMEGSHISAVRTAAVSLAAVEAVRGLAGVRRPALLGCGRQARTHLELLCARTRPAAVTVYDIDAARGAALARYARTLAPDAAVTAVARPEAAVRAADVVVAATTTVTPYVPLEWLRPGAVFVNVSLDDATEDLLLGCDHLFVDDWALVAGDDTRLLGRLAQAGRVTAPGGQRHGGPAPSEPRDPPRPRTGSKTGAARPVDAELAHLLSGAYPRPIGPGDRVVVNPFGMGVHDIALAARVHAAARETGAGTRLPR